MNRLTYTVQIVSAVLAKGQHSPSDIQDLLRSVHSALPADEPMPAIATESPAESPQESISNDDGPEPQKAPMSMTEALAASRSWFAAPAKNQNESEQEAHAS